MRVVLVDDQELIRRGMRLLLETTDGVEVVGEAADGQEGLAVVRQLSPDVVLTDARMPGLDGVGLITALRTQSDAPPAIVLTTFDDEHLVRSALDAGAAGFLLKDASPEEVVNAMHAVIGGGLVIDPRVARTAMMAPAGPDESGSPGPDADSPFAVLTRAERDVAALVATGATNAEIAASLVLAEGTVKNHVSALLRKLDQRDRTGLALLLSRYLG
ncbi:response regulator transcription factor [Nocardioides sp. GXZ039]|uniref:response regulator transcription factor n=1 Tax=Nocardioides sp. GXZ039 TaxID=3136018 RepID=UPI0030F37759